MSVEVTKEGNCGNLANVFNMDKGAVNVDMKCMKKHFRLEDKFIVWPDDKEKYTSLKESNSIWDFNNVLVSLMVGV